MLCLKPVYKGKRVKQDTKATISDVFEVPEGTKGILFVEDDSANGGINWTEMQPNPIIGTNFCCTVGSSKDNSEISYIPAQRDGIEAKQKNKIELNQIVNLIHPGN